MYIQIDDNLRCAEYLNLKWPKNKIPNIVVNYKMITATTKDNLFNCAVNSVLQI